MLIDFFFSGALFVSFFSYTLFVVGSFLFLFDRAAFLFNGAANDLRESTLFSGGVAASLSLSLSEVTTHPPTAATQPPTRPAKSDGQWAFDRQVARFPVDCVLGLVCLNSRTSLTRGSRGEEAHTLSHTHPHTHTQKGKTPNVDNDRRRRCKGNKKNETSTND